MYNLRGERGFGNGRSAHIDTPIEWQATSIQACGLWPFGSTASTSNTGIPMGFHLTTGSPFCCDPISWFLKSKIISNPSMFVLGRPGLGKSTFIRRQIVGMMAGGVYPMVLGDVKPDYADLLRINGGQIIDIGIGFAGFNILNPGRLFDWFIHCRQHNKSAAERIFQELCSYQFNMLISILSIIRNSYVVHDEQTLLYKALVYLNNICNQAPTIKDLLYVFLNNKYEIMRGMNLDSADDYKRLVQPIHGGLLSLIEGPMKGIFCNNSLNHIDIDRYKGVCFNISEIGEYDFNMQAAIMLACWSDGFATINRTNILVDYGMANNTSFYVILDELWRILRVGHGIVDRIDVLTRLNRKYVTAQVMITHTLDDLQSLPEKSDIVKARGFVERSGIVVMGGLSNKECESVSKIISLSSAEQSLIVNWASPASLNTMNYTPPGCGRFLVKVANSPGIPIQVVLTPREASINDTNVKWHRDRNALEDGSVSNEPVFDNSATRILEPDMTNSFNDDID